MTDQLVRRVVATDDGIVIEKVPPLVPGPAEALIELRAAGVCGSDLHALACKHPFVPLPYHPGHEAVGIVRALGAEAAVGADGKPVAVGQRVVIEPPLPCWHCKMCAGGRENLCENMQFFGTVYPQGAMAEQYTIPARRLHQVPDELTDAAAAIVEPLATPIHAIGLAGGVTGKAVAILGAGTIGQLLVCAVRAQHPAKIVITDLRADNRERASALGADHVLDAAQENLVAAARDALGESADVVFDCVALQSTMDTAIELADKGGTVVVVGVPQGDVRVPLPIIQDHQIRIQGSATYLPPDFDVAIELLRSGAVDANAIVTAQYPLAQAAAAFAAASEGGQVKVLITAD
ncbi:MAG: alcohol dehydrogenase catalytic domain-containing protein [Actinomycetia bacterium]|nr:alcohol dehydrogenase catalytic domain-containing protein [Actinomycetes bacterium]